MTAKQKLRWAAFIRGLDFDTLYATPVAGVLDYAFYQSKYQTVMLKVVAALDEQTTDVTASTPTKTSAKINMSEVVHKFIMRGAVKANMLTKFELEESLKKPISYFLFADDLEAGERALKMKKIVQDNLGDLTNISLDNIDEMSDAILAFQTIKEKPTTLVGVKKSKGTDLIPGLLNELDAIIVYKGMLIGSYLPDLLVTFNQFIKVGETSGARHVSLIAIFLDDVTGIPRQRIKVTLTNGTRTITKSSTRKGTARFRGLEPGNWTLKADHKTYVSVSKSEIAVEDGNVTKLVFKLKKLKEAGLYGSAHGMAYNKANGQGIPYALFFLEGIETPIVANEFGNWVKDNIPKQCSWMRVTAHGFDIFQTSITINPNNENELNAALDATNIEPPHGE